jgi:hypothetical protein
MGVGSLEYLYGARSIGGYGTSKEAAAGTEAELGWAEGIFDRTIRARLAHEATGAGGRILTLSETIDAVVEQYHVEVDIAAIGVDEVITTDSEAVAVATHLPYRELRVGHLTTCGDSCGTTMDGVHAIGVHVVGQAA